MENNEIKSIQRELEDKGFTLARIGRENGVTRQHVRNVLYGGTSSTIIRGAIATILGRNPWAKKPADKKAS